MNNLIQKLKGYRDGKIKCDIEDLVWEAVKLGLSAVPINGATYLCKDGSWLIKLDSNGGVEFSKDMNYYELLNNVI